MNTAPPLFGGFKQNFITVAGYGLFWTWNLIFLAFMTLGFAPYVLPDLLVAVRAGIIPTPFLLFGVMLVLIPLISVIIGATRLRTAPDRLLIFGYGVEGPLMLLLGVRFFAIREITPAIGVILTIGALGMLTLLWHILDLGKKPTSSWKTHLRVIGLTLILLIGIYASVWIAFYALPLAVQAVVGIATFFWNLPSNLAFFRGDLRDLYIVPLMALWLVLFTYSATIFVAMPIVVPTLYMRTWWQNTRNAAATVGKFRTMLLVMLPILICAILIVVTNRQPQQVAFDLLQDPPTSLEASKTLLVQEEAIRAGLLNSYLASFRYVSAEGSVLHINEMYQWALGLSEENAQRVQNAYELVARPLLYRPTEQKTDAETGASTSRIRDNQIMRLESEQAAELYEAFFDVPINDGERGSVVYAVRSTWLPDAAEAAWQAVDDREVHLKHQELTIAEAEGWADVELYEVYQNHTVERQEVVYYFNLPESAVVTGIWLGTSDDRAERFEYKVAPRGAAQAVYRNEIQRQQDPALVEQIGPRQYRLRVFPIEPRTLSRDSNAIGPALLDAPPLHMWLTWRVMLHDSGWPMPQLAEWRNIFWDSETVRQLNGEAVDQSASADVWLPPRVPASEEALASAPTGGHRIDFANGQSVVVHPTGDDDIPALPAELSLAIVVDRSRSMVNLADDVAKALAQLHEITTDADVYLTASEFRGEGASVVPLSELNPAEIIYFGGQNAAELLTQYDSLHENQEYDAVIVLTDGTGYALGDQEISVPPSDAPIWMVHLNGGFPLGYDDATLEVIQSSGGGVVGSVDEALNRLSIQLDFAPDDSASNAKFAQTADLVDGYLWQTLPTELVEDHPGSLVYTEAGGFTAFGARRLVLAEMQRQRGTLDQLDVLDQLHALAIENSVVTPYSSMIVLVNERQEKLLEELEGNADRFDREHEDVGDTLPENALAVTGVPEPEEWLLLILVVAMIGWYVRSSKQNRSKRVVVG